MNISELRRRISDTIYDIQSDAETVTIKVGIHNYEIEDFHWCSTCLQLHIEANPLTSYALSCGEVGFRGPAFDEPI